jgi:hypothetical protein
MSHPFGVDVERIRRELGFGAAVPLTWAGKVEKKDYPIAELPEFTVTFLEATPNEPQGLFDRIKEAFG